MKDSKEMKKICIVTFTVFILVCSLALAATLTGNKFDIVTFNNVMSEQGYEVSESSLLKEKPNSTAFTYTSGNSDIYFDVVEYQDASIRYSMCKGSLDASYDVVEYTTDYGTYCEQECLDTNQYYICAVRGNYILESWCDLDYADTLRVIVTQSFLSKAIMQDIDSIEEISGI